MKEQILLDFHLNHKKAAVVNWGNMPKAADKTRRRRQGDIDEDSGQSSQSQRRAQKNKRGRPNRGDDDEDMEVDQSQPSTQASQGQKASKLTKAEMERKVAELVRYLLFVDRKKCPIKRGDITKNVLREHAKAFNEVFDLAKAQLRKIFSIEVEEIEMGKSKAFVLVDTIENEEKNELMDWGDDLPKMGLLMVVLSLIFMSDARVMNESLLWHTLKKLGLEPKHEHKDFEDPEKLLTQEFMRQGYLDRKKLASSDGATFEYRWGPRAYKELTKRQVLQFVAEMYETSMEDWRSQMNEIIEEENGNNSE